MLKKLRKKFDFEPTRHIKAMIVDRPPNNMGNSILDMPSKTRAKLSFSFDATKPWAICIQKSTANPKDKTQFTRLTGSNLIPQKKNIQKTKKKNV